MTPYTTPQPSSPRNREALLVASLLLLELSILVFLAAMYMKGERLFSTFLSSKPGMVFLGAIVIFCATGGVVVQQYLTRRRSQFHHFWPIVMMNVVTVVLIVGIGEITVRMGSHSDAKGIAFSNIRLISKSWGEAKLRYRQQFRKARGDLSYMVYDELLGWTVRPERRSTDGLYYSNSEGMRTEHQAISFAKSESQIEIALVGDSFTFGEEVRYEETWAHHLDQALGENFRVLNYGVPGYGIGQAYLRYEKDIRQRKPQVVIFGFITHDLFRTMWPYPFLAIPSSIPFAEPRFALVEGKLRPVNLPLPPPDKVFSKRSPADLPFIEYQAGYRSGDWEGSVFDHLYLFRLFGSIFPQWQSDPAHAVTDELLSVNRSILQAFRLSATVAGSSPLIVYFPTRWDLKHPSTPSISKQLLLDADIPFIDPTPCLLEVNPSDRFLVSHYSAQSNAAVAKCVYKALSELLDKASLLPPKSNEAIIPTAQLHSTNLLFRGPSPEGRYRGRHSYTEQVSRVAHGK